MSRLEAVVLRVREGSVIGIQVLLVVCMQIVELGYFESLDQSP